MDLCKFKANLIYRDSFRAARPVQRNPVSRKKPTNQTKKISIVVVNKSVSMMSCPFFNKDIVQTV